jgi:hypothetical protein
LVASAGAVKDIAMMLGEPTQPERPISELPESEKEVLPRWQSDDHKHGTPFKIFPREWTAKQIYEWLVKQGWAKDRRGDEPATGEPPA